jgi:hypothetical protein
MAKRKQVALATTVEVHSIALSQVIALRGAKVNRELGIIENVAIISQGPAIGHGFDVDDVMTRQVRDKLKAAKTRVHFTHAHAQGGFFTPAVDGIGSLAGHVIPSSVHIESGVVRGDIQLSKASANQPGMGNLRQYLLDMAEESPDHFGLSIVFEPDEFEKRVDANNQSLPPAGRVKAVTAVDFVEDPGANPNGLLSKADSTPKGKIMNPELKAYLESIGLKKDATDAEAQAFALSLKTPEQIESAKLLAKVELAAEIGKQTALATANKVAADKAASDALAAANAPNAADTMLAKMEADTKVYTQLARVAKLDEAGIEAFVAKHLEAGSDCEAAKADSLAILKSKFANPHIKSHATVVTGGGNLGLETLGEAMQDAIMLRAGHNKLVKLDAAGNVVFGSDGKPETCVPHERATRFRQLSIPGMIRVWLQTLGVADASELSDVRLASLIGGRELRKSYPDAYALAQSTSDFGSILENVMNKSLRQAYLDAPKTWSVWARRATAPDFKNISRPALSEVPSLQNINESGGIKYVTLTDSKETYALQEYIGGILLTRRAIINDDLNAFSRIPMQQAQAAARTEEDVAYAVLTGNPEMADGHDLFDDTNHFNALASGGAVPYTVAAILPTWNRMRKQKGPKLAARLDLTPRFLIVPTAQEIGAQQFVSSVVDPSKNNATPNPFNGRLTVVANSRLDDQTTATQWYLAADYRDNQVDTVEVCFLENEPMPVLKQETDFDTEDVRFAVRHTVAAKAIDFRGLTRDKGAA